MRRRQKGFRTAKLQSLILVLVLVIGLAPFTNTFGADVNDDGIGEVMVREPELSVPGEPQGEDPQGEEPQGEEPQGEEPQGEDPQGEEPQPSTPALGPGQSPASPQVVSPSGTALGSISGFLWADGDGSLPTDWDGLYNGKEQPLTGYTVCLYDAADLNAALAVTTTDTTGTYIFEGLTPGDYVLGLGSATIYGAEYLLPMSITAENAFEIDWASSPLMAYTQVIQIDEGQDVADINAGMRLPMGITPLASYTIDIANMSTGSMPTGVTYNGMMDLTFTSAATGNDYVLMASATRLLPLNITFDSGVTTTVTLRDLNYSGNITLLGTANVTMLLDGTNVLNSGYINAAEKTVSEGVTTIATLTIDSATSPGSSIGSLKVIPNAYLINGAGIGGLVNEGGGRITFNGGTVEVDLSAMAGRTAAAIGGGSNDVGTGGGGGTITFNNNCVVIAKNTNVGAGIGGGQNGSGGTITINGGTITASSGGGAGIGAGANAGATSGTMTISGGTITINGGTVNASATSGAGIGSATIQPGQDVDYGTIKITGGTVTATSAVNGAGIGSGGMPSNLTNYFGGTVIIEGGTVNATGSTGIGAGSGAANGGNISISNGTVTATGDTGIGGGYGGIGNAGNISITGGTVVATGGWGAGIGGGGYGGSGATLTISPSANIKAYSRGVDRPAIDAAGPIQGGGYYVNALFDAIVSTTSATDLYVFNAGYSGGNANDRINTLTLPANYRAFGYNTAGAARSDFLFAVLDLPDDIRVIDRVFDDQKPIYSINNLDGYDTHNESSAAGSGILNVKLRQMPVAGAPSVDNVEKYDADLTSTGHAVGPHVFESGGFFYSTTASAGRPSGTITDLPWGISAFITTPITRNTETDAAVPGTKLIPNSKYYAISYLEATVDLWLINPTTPMTVESAAVVDFVTKPSITSGTVVETGTPGEVKISSVFEGGQEALTARIYYGTGAIDRTDPLTWPVTYVDLDFALGEFSYAGFTDYVINTLSPGVAYNFLIVIENETGWDSYPLGFVDKVNVRLSKTITGDFADLTKTFTFTVYFTDGADNPLPAGTSFSYTGGTISGLGATPPPNGSLNLNGAGSATVTLGHGQTITIANVPANNKIRIVETAATQYTASFKDSEDASRTYSNDTGLRVVGSNLRVFDFTNERGTVPIVGIWDEGVTRVIGMLLAVLFALGDWVLIKFWRRRRWAT